MHQRVVPSEANKASLVKKVGHFDVVVDSITITHNKGAATSSS